MQLNEDRAGERGRRAGCAPLTANFWVEVTVSAGAVPADPAGLPSFLVHNRTETLPSSGLTEKRESLFKNTLPTFSTVLLSPRELQLSQGLYSDSTFFFGYSQKQKPLV